MPLSSIGKNLSRLNNFEPPSGLAGQVVETAIIGKAIEGIGDGLGTANIFKHATENILKGASVLTSSFRKMATKKDHHNTVQDGIHNIQDMPKSNVSDIKNNK